MTRRDPSVRLTMEQWCRLCDALSVAPDNTIAFVLEKAETLKGIRERRPLASETVRR